MLNAALGARAQDYQENSGIIIVSLLRAALL
jgi:hypothetical protein